MLSVMTRSARYCLLALTLLPGYARAAQWGVIASTYDTLRETHVIGEGNLNDVLQEAVQSCRKNRPGQDCFAVAAVQDGCVAWAVDRRGHWGWSQLNGLRQSPEAVSAMERKALEQCSQDPEAGRCRIAHTICTDDRDVP